MDKLLDVAATWKTFESELEAAIHLESAPRLRVGDLGEADTLAVVTKDIIGYNTEYILFLYERGNRLSISA